MGDPVLRIPDSRSRAVSDRSLYDPAQARAYRLDWRTAWLECRPERDRRTQPRWMEPDASERLGAGSPARMGRPSSGWQRYRGADARTPGITPSRGLGRAAAAGNWFPVLRAPGLASVVATDAAAAPSTSPVVASGSRWASRAALLGRDEVHRARGRRREDQHRPALIDSAGTDRPGEARQPVYSSSTCWAGPRASRRDKRQAPRGRR